AMSVWVDKHGNRYYFKEDEMIPDNPQWNALISAIITPPEPPLRQVDRFWVHQAVNSDDPIWFDDEQLVDEVAKLIHIDVPPEEAAEKLGFKAGWFVVKSITYQRPDGSTFIKNEPVEDDKGQWYPATEAEIASALVAKAELAKQVKNR
ncbi:hypothetical protein IIZ77_02240, partial [Candidatus Saccharibacteria bacterium]|nr:hypothetical protein [Candidatus Saccharibacteria bacterium]